MQEENIKWEYKRTQGTTFGNNNIYRFSKEREDCKVDWVGVTHHVREKQDCWCGHEWMQVFEEEVSVSLISTILGGGEILVIYHMVKFIL